MAAVPFERFRREVLDFYSAHRRRGTFLKVRQALGMTAELGPRSTRDLTPALVARFVAASRASGRSDVTTANLVSAFRACCGYAERLGWLARNPFAVVRDWQLDTDPADLPRHLGREQVVAVLALADARAADWKGRRLRALAYLLAFTGLRRGEALHLKPSDVDLAEGFLRVPRRRRGWRPKTRASAAPVPIPPDLAPVLAAWLAECGPDWIFPGVTRRGPWTGGPAGARPLDALRALGLSAGVRGLNFQVFRHTFASMAAAWDMGPIALRLWLRHTTNRTQTWYIHPDAATLRESASRVRYWPAPAPA